MANQKSAINLLKEAYNQQKEIGLGGITVPVDTLKKIQRYAKPKTTSQTSSEVITLEQFEQQINNCTKCKLHQGRNKFVFGVGNPNSRILFIGEGPGRDEDLKGEPFVGRAGKLLDKIIEAINFQRSDIYIANIVKCRPPGNRDPQPDEMTECMPYLYKQIELIDPELICCLGRVAAQVILQTKTSLGKLRGRFHDFHGRKLMVTYHPAALLRFPKYKKDTWEDVQMLRREYDNLPPL